jgi:hypothetical protein
MAHTNVKSAWIDGNLAFYDKDGNLIGFKNGAAGAANSAPNTIRKRCTLAEVNAGVTVLPAIAGFKYRMIDVIGISIGGAMATLTTVDVLGTQATTGVKLAAFAQASLTQSTVLRPGVAGTAVIADGASFTACDANTAITVGKTGGTGATATHVDIILTYAIEAA